MGFNEAVSIKPTQAHFPTTYKLNGSEGWRKGHMKKNKLQTGSTFYE
jgi:hypothetical protein